MVSTTAGPTSEVEWEAVAIGVLQSSPPPDPAAGPRWHLVSYAEGEPYASLQRAMEEGHPGLRFQMP